MGGPIDGVQPTRRDVDAFSRLSGLDYRSIVGNRQKDGSVRLEQVIFVRRDSQKAIVLGKRGQSIREIGSQARLEMEHIFGHKVHLFLFVKVRDNWIDDPERYRMMGIDYAGVVHAMES